jgi:hypothetical protein
MNVTKRIHCSACGIEVYQWRGRMYKTEEAAEEARAEELKRRHDFRWMRKAIERAKQRRRAPNGSR